ncbi:MAG: thiamine pyrophosphate-dependent dehydrogenase E1 component subunit alpha [Oscillospiraceae bacterium]|nr:thiamine pyrophosphate-dependent dehydrogenase E1 component subunit alpha [Oscillospiraceae bacterium]
MSLRDDPKLAASMYASMYRIRRFEEEVFEFYKRGLMPGLAHLYIGEEAVAVGACAAIRADDYVGSTHRGHGHLLARGADSRRMMAEILGKETGYCRGKGGSMHIMDMNLGILGANGIVGGGIPIATGAGYSCKYRGTDQVVLCFFGDGAANEGTFHESINMAAAWDLPVVYIIENNHYGITVSVDRVTKEHDLAKRALGYGIDGYTVDGNDVETVYDTVAKAVAKARAGGGPSIVECKTYRQHGHNGGDNGAYRPEGELDAWKQRDPLKLFREAGYLPEEKLREIEESVEAEIRDACRFAEESPYPDASELMQGIFYEG